MIALVDYINRISNFLGVDIRKHVLSSRLGETQEPTSIRRIRPQPPQIDVAQVRAELEGLLAKPADKYLCPMARDIANDQIRRLIPLLPQEKRDHYKIRAEKAGYHLV